MEGNSTAASHARPLLSVWSLAGRDVATACSQVERERAEREKRELTTQWRSQTEGWFRSATAEMQATLIGDWGTAELVRVLGPCRPLAIQAASPLRIGIEFLKRGQSCQM